VAVNLVGKHVCAYGERGERGGTEEDEVEPIDVVTWDRR